jgi:hypothetical protein
MFKYINVSNFMTCTLFCLLTEQHALKISNIYLSSCLSVCLFESSERPGCWTNPHQIWYGGLTLQGPGHRLCFGPWGGPPRVRGALNTVWRASTAATVRLGKKLIKQKL